MCLITTKKVRLVKVYTTKRVLPKPDVAKENIKVFKRFVEKSDGSLFSPYQNSPYKKGETRTATLKITDDYKDRARVDDGIHAYRLRSTAKNTLGYGEVVIACTIPKGTRYLVGKHGDIVAEKLIVGVKRGRPLGVKDSYKRKTKKKTARKKRK